MKIERLNQWLILGSNLGILAGLVLVTFQIRQDSEIARAQLFSDVTTSRIEMAGRSLGENPAPIIARSLEAPHELTTAELHVMDAYYISGLNEVRRSQALRRVGLDLGIAAPENVLAFYFGSESAQRWWARFMLAHPADPVLEELDQLVQALDGGFSLSILNDMRVPSPNH